MGWYNFLIFDQWVSVGDLDKTPAMGVAIVPFAQKLLVYPYLSTLYPYLSKLSTLYPYLSKSTPTCLSYLSTPSKSFSSSREPWVRVRL